MLSQGRLPEAVRLFLVAFGSVEVAANAEFEDEDGKVMSLLYIVSRVDNQKLKEAVCKQTNAGERMEVVSTLLSQKRWSEATKLFLAALRSDEDAVKTDFKDENGNAGSFLSMIFKQYDAKLMDEVWAMTDGAGRVKSLANLPMMWRMDRNDFFVSFLKTKWDEIDDEAWAHFAESARESMMASTRFIPNGWRPENVDHYLKVIEYDGVQDCFQSDYLERLESEWNEKASDPDQLEEFKAVMVKEMSTLHQMVKADRNEKFVEFIRKIWGKMEGAEFCGNTARESAKYVPDFYRPDESHIPGTFKHKSATAFFKMTKAPSSYFKYLKQ